MTSYYPRVWRIKGPVSPYLKKFKSKYIYVIQGGFAIVYVAEDIIFDTEFALKVRQKLKQSFNIIKESNFLLF
jgi:hypothetical protein